MDTIADQFFKTIAFLRHRYESAEGKGMPKVARGREPPTPARLQLYANRLFLPLSSTCFHALVVLPATPTIDTKQYTDMQRELQKGPCSVTFPFLGGALTLLVDAPRRQVLVITPLRVCDVPVIGDTFGKFVQALSGDSSKEPYDVAYISTDDFDYAPVLVTATTAYLMCVLGLGARDALALATVDRLKLSLEVERELLF